MKLHRIKQTRGSAPPLSLSPSPSFSLSITLCRACYSIGFVLVRRVQVRRLTFRLSDDRGARRGGGGTQTRAYTRIHARPSLSLAPCDLNTALCHGIPSALHNRTVPPWNVLHAHKRRTCSIEGKATCHALCHTACPHPLYPPMTLHLALREGGWHRYSLSLSLPLYVCFSPCSLLDWMLGASSSRLITFRVGLVSLLGRSWDGQVPVCGKFSY